MLPINRLRGISVLCIFVLSGCVSQEGEGVTEWVDPFIGTAGTGHTFPGATMPFGMVQLSPDTRQSGWENCSGYHSSNPTILGFSHTHLSGTGAIDYGDILFAPMSGQLLTEPGEETDPETGYRSAFSHASEKAEPGYYRVILKDDMIEAEMTVTERVGFHRYTFTQNGDSHILIDLKHGLGDRTTEAWTEINGTDEIIGMRRSTGWAKDQVIYFVAKFSRPFQSTSLFIDGEAVESNSARGTDIKAGITFDLDQQRQVLTKLAISAVDIEGARQNLERELPHWDFEAVRREAKNRWEEMLSVITVKGGTKEHKTNFYTALYHSLIAPNVFSDVDGRYRGADFEIHQLPPGRSMYTVFSLWDTFRAAHPLFVLLYPDLATEFVRTLIAKYEEGDLLPVWELAGNETGTMIGYHSIPVISDAYVKGLRDYDVEVAYSAMKKSAKADHLGLKHYKEKGYIPIDRENEGVSKTLEYAYDDWCIAQMSAELGYQKDYDYYMRRAMNYHQVFDYTTKFMRGKKGGQWESPFDPFAVTAAYTEANAWQYTYFVPHDISGMMEMMGGESSFVNRLDDLFSASKDLSGRYQPDITGLIGQYAHGNEPSHNFAYLYNHAGQPWKSQKVVRQIMDTLYHTGRDGLPGNEDCGQMSAWYVFSALGFYPVTPGQDIYAIGTPIFDEATIHLENGKSFTIHADDASPGKPYIQNSTLNETELHRSYLSHSEIASGGELQLKMGSKPNQDWATDPTYRPKSAMNLLVVSNPVFDYKERGFLDSMTISISTPTQGATIHYTVDGSRPSDRSPVYDTPLHLNRTTEVRALAIKEDFSPSYVESVTFTRIPYRISVTYNHPYSHLYTAGGNNGLFDGVRGALNAWGSWQGFHAVDLDAVIDLGEVRKVNRITATCLQSWASWIWLPKSVTFSVSQDGRTFKSLGRQTHDVSLEKDGSFTKDFVQETSGEAIRYIKLFAENVRTCPDWHPGATGKAWIFIDEVVIE
ncbi:MAG: GH92 family glycosyl hydrolase [Candidatus Neomarinimicrobiota bacterium]|nr:GH92 family glycosyl hydrolase [Candidatus Neomarinimicrobiota bacterium]